MNREWSFSETEMWNSNVQDTAWYVFAQGYKWENVQLFAEIWICPVVMEFTL